MRFIPPRCPWQHCAMHTAPTKDFFVRNGFYQPMCRDVPVPRFICKDCGRGFSRQTFRVDYYDKKPHQNVPLLIHLISRGGLRQAARALPLARSSVEAKWVKFARHVKWLHPNLMGTFPDSVSLMMDELETFENDRIECPVTMPILIDRHSLYIVAAHAGSAPARGSKRGERAKEKRRRGLETRKSESSAVVRRVLDVAAHHMREGAKVTLITDKKKTYPNIAKRAFVRQRLTVEQYPGKAARTTQNPLFRINLTLAMSRDNVSRLTRRSWLVSKKKERLDLHYALFVAFRNYRRRRTNRDVVAPAEILGFIPRPLEWGEFIGWRQDWGPRSIHPMNRFGS